MGVRRTLYVVRRSWRALALAVGALCACALSVRVPAPLQLAAHLSVAEHFPALAPAHLAHALADFSNQPYVSSWWVEEDRSNYTSWRYTVSYKCGARCSGHGTVLAHDEPLHAAPRHGLAARLHRVALALRSCTALPLLPWPRLCDELDISWVVSSAADGGGGALLQEEWSMRCSALAWLSGACERSLRSRRDLLSTRLRSWQPAAPHPHPPAPRAA